MRQIKSQLRSALSIGRAFNVGTTTAGRLLNQPNGTAAKWRRPWPGGSTTGPARRSI